jgi:hypothetical protein
LKCRSCNDCEVCIGLAATFDAGNHHASVVSRLGHSGAIATEPGEHAGDIGWRGWLGKIVEHKIGDRDRMLQSDIMRAEFLRRRIRSSGNDETGWRDSQFRRAAPRAEDVPKQGSAGSGGLGRRSHGQNSNGQQQRSKLHERTIARWRGPRLERRRSALRKKKPGLRAAGGSSRKSRKVREAGSPAVDGRAIDRQERGGHPFVPEFGPASRRVSNSVTRLL